MRAARDVGTRAVRENVLLLNNLLCNMGDTERMRLTFNRVVYMEIGENPVNGITVML